MAARWISSTAPARASARDERSESRIGQMIAAHEIVEFGGLAIEAQRHLADRAMALLGDDHFARPMHLLEPFLPASIAFVELVHAFVGSMGRLAAAQIIFL